MKNPDGGLKAIVADLYLLRYRTGDIAIVVGRSERTVRVIVEELFPRPSTPRSVHDLPHDMRDRVLQWIEQSEEDLPNRHMRVTA